jgi:hypothetical protein
MGLRSGEYGGKYRNQAAPLHYKLPDPPALVRREVSIIT